jgi:hypothetical protein
MQRHRERPRTKGYTALTPQVRLRQALPALSHDIPVHISACPRKWPPADVFGPPQFAVTAATSVRHVPRGSPGALQALPTLRLPQDDRGRQPRTSELSRRLCPVTADESEFWTVPHYLASDDPAVYGVGIAFVRRTFGLCVACFGLTNAMTGALLMLWGNGLEHLVFDDVCAHYTHWSCTQWAVDGVLVLFIIPGPPPSLRQLPESSCSSRKLTTRTSRTGKAAGGTALLEYSANTF